MDPERVASASERIEVRAERYGFDCGLAGQRATPHKGDVPAFLLPAWRRGNAAGRRVRALRAGAAADGLRTGTGEA